MLGLVFFDMRDMYMEEMMGNVKFGYCYAILSNPRPQRVTGRLHIDKTNPASSRREDYHIIFEPIVVI